MNYYYIVTNDQNIHNYYDTIQKVFINHNLNVNNIIHKFPNLTHLTFGHYFNQSINKLANSFLFYYRFYFF